MTLEKITESNIGYAVRIQAELFPGESARANYEESLGKASGYEYDLVYEDGVCVGITGLYSIPEDPDSAWLGWFGIREGFRRRHLGSKVLKVFEETASSRGFCFARLYTDAEKNDAAIAFYKANGYACEPYENAQDPVSLEHRTIIFSKLLSSEPLVPWNNRNIHLTEQAAKQEKNRCPEACIERTKEGEYMLETKRLILRRWEESDAESLFEYAKDPDVGPIAGWPAHQSMDESLNVIRNVFTGREAYAVCLKSDRKAVGAIELKLNGRTDMTERDDECEIGYWLGKPFWGQGMMPEAVKEMLRHAFEDLGMTKVWAGYYEGNKKSKRVQEKAGFRYQWKSEDVDVPLMHEKRTGHVSSITKDQWQWDRLYEAASAVRKERRLSEYVTCGEVSAAILSGSGEIYTGVCIDTCATLGICAERNAIFNMITNGEQEIRKVLAILPDGSSGAPCGACRELMVQLMPEKYKGIEVMMDYSRERTITLGELTPEWWI